MKKDYKTSVPQEKLDASEAERQRLLAKWRFEPTSMWYLQRLHDKTLDAIVEDTLAEGSYPEHNFNVRDGALPQSSPIVAERLIRFFSEPGDWVFNPFMERIPHLLVANYLGRNAVGQDLCKSFYEHDVAKVKRRIANNAILDSEHNYIDHEEPTYLRSYLNGLVFDLYLGDSRCLPWSNNSMDFCINSPPYFSTIYYSDEPEQLGTGEAIGGGDKPTYEEFLKGLQDVYRECYRVLKPGKFMAVLLNDFRMDKIFRAYHADLIPYMEEIGWHLHDIIIYNLSLHPLQAVFTSQLARDFHMAKQHEYIEIYRKSE